MCESVCSCCCTFSCALSCGWTRTVTLVTVTGDAAAAVNAQLITHVSLQAHVNLYKGETHFSGRVMNVRFSCFMQTPNRKQWLDANKFCLDNTGFAVHIWMLERRKLHHRSALFVTDPHSGCRLPASCGRGIGRGNPWGGPHSDESSRHYWPDTRSDLQKNQNSSYFYWYDC